MAGSPVNTAHVLSGYLDAIRRGQRLEAFVVVESARSDGLDLTTLYLKVFQPALREIGRLWEENELSVADEHLATAITQAAMLKAFQDDFTWNASPGHSLLAACADFERHDLGLRMICDLLDVQGWNTTYLGASVPVPDLVTMIAKLRPDAVALSVSLDEHLPRIEHAVRSIRDVLTDPPLLLVGGRPFLDKPELAAMIGADFTATDAEMAVRLLIHRLHAS